MNIGSFFQTGPIPPGAMSGHYILSIVALSYLVATIASFVALDITERIRTQNESSSFKLGWLVCGALAMGIGIWTMHFIGMLAFVMPMPMTYNIRITLASLVIAIIASGFALFLVKDEKVRKVPLIMGGILLGLGIASMHYTGMAAMKDVTIHYLPGLFALSIAIAIVASEVALLLMILSSKTYIRYHTALKLSSAVIMGFAICGMHYTGMFAAVFHMSETSTMSGSMAASSGAKLTDLSPETLSLYLGGTIITIISIFLLNNRFWINTLEVKNKNLAEAEEKIQAILAVAADGIVVLNKEGKIELCNRAAGEIFDYDPKEMLGKDITSFIKDAEKKVEGTQLVTISIEKLLDHKGVLSEHVGICKSGNSVPIDLNISTLVLKNATFYILVFRDITERKIAEENLKNLNQQLVSSARYTGMAEVASCILHNVGNILNSVNTSAQLLLNRNNQTKIEGFTQFSQLLKQQGDGLSEFIKTDPLGQALPNYLNELAISWKNEDELIHKEIESLNEKIAHVKNIISMQQTLSRSVNMIEDVQINDLIEDSLTINSEVIKKSGVVIERDYEHTPLLKLDKGRVLQILINLTKNAAEALDAVDTKNKKITLRTKQTGNNLIQIEVTDNGIGIQPENLNKIFNYGFTTKQGGHGFGLHTCMLSLQEIEGSLKVYSEGLNKGSTFVLTLQNQAAKS